MFVLERILALACWLNPFEWVRWFELALPQGHHDRHEAIGHCEGHRQRSTKGALTVGDEEGAHGGSESLC